MNIMLMEYQTEKDGKWKKGIRVEGSKDNIYLDKHGNILTTIYDSKWNNLDFCISLNKLLK